MLGYEGSLPKDNEKADRKSGQPSLEFFKQFNQRELDILQLLTDGLLRRENATRLIISLNTDKTYAHNIYNKLWVHNQLQPVGKTQGLGLLEQK